MAELDKRRVTIQRAIWTSQTAGRPFNGLHFVYLEVVWFRPDCSSAPNHWVERECLNPELSAAPILLPCAHDAVK